MDVYQLRALCAVVDEGSFAAAAEALGLTQPALSMQLSRLEAEAGFPLFLKAGRRKVLGSEGLVVLGYARRILAEFRALDDELAAFRGLGAGTLTLAASDTVVRHLLADPVAAFSLRWPGLHLHVWNRTSAETVEGVRDGQADLGFVTLPVEAPGLAVRPWRPFAWVAAAPASLWGAAAEPLTLEALAASTLVLLEPGTRLHDLWVGHCEARGLSRGRTVESGSIDVQLDFAARGLGVALVPDYAVNRRDLAVRPVPELGQGTLAVVQRPGRRPPAVTAFLEAFFPRPGELV